MYYNDLKEEIQFVEANAIRFYMRQEGWVNRGEIVSYKEAYTSEADHSATNPEQPQAHRRLTWIDWVRSL